MKKEEAATNGGESEKCKNENEHYVTSTKWGKCEERVFDSSEVTYGYLSCFFLRKQLAPLNSDTAFFFFLLSTLLWKKLGN